MTAPATNDSAVLVDLALDAAVQAFIDSDGDSAVWDTAVDMLAAILHADATPAADLLRHAVDEAS